MSRFQTILLSTAGLIGAFGVTVSAQESADTPSPDERPDKQSVIMVLDGSGSMWGQIDGTPKIDIARDVIGGLLKNWDTNVELGLMAYGHRTKGDCDDIETLVNVGPVSADTIMKTVKEINPVGKTPISASVRHAAEELKFTEEKATVILVSDGLETCSADPCALAKELETKGIDFTAHVIGFDVAKADQAKLSCLAEETGGKFFSAENAGELNEALQETIETVVEAEPEPAPEPVVKEEVFAGDQGINLRAKLCEDCDLIEENLYWVVTEPSLTGKGKKVDAKGGDDPFIELVPGEYTVTVTHGDIKRSQDFTVEAAEPETLVINLNAGYAQIKSTAKEGGEVLDKGMYYKIFPAQKDLDGGRKQVAQTGNDMPLLKLPAGDYVVLAKHGQAEVEYPFTVKAGERSDYTINMNVGYFKLTTVLAEGGDPIEKGLYYKVYLPEKDLSGKRKQVAQNGGETPTFKLSEGEYVVTSKMDRALGEKTVEVNAGLLGEAVVVLNAGRVKMNGVLEKGSDEIVKKVRWEIYGAKQDLDGKRKFIGNSGQGTPVFTLHEGDYVVRAKYGGKFTENEFSIKAGEEKIETVVVTPKEE